MGSETVLARYYAMREVKAEAKAQGLKPQYIEPCQLVQAARLYLDRHPELIERACAALRTNAQRGKAQSIRPSAVQMSCSKRRTES